MLSRRRKEGRTEGEEGGREGKCRRLYEREIWEERWRDKNMGLMG